MKRRRVIVQKTIPFLVGRLLAFFDIDVLMRRGGDELLATLYRPRPRLHRERTIWVNPRPRSVGNPPRRLVGPRWDCRFAGTERWTRSPRAANMHLPVSAPFQATYMWQFGNVLLIVHYYDPPRFRLYRGNDGNSDGECKGPWLEQNDAFS